MSTRQLCSIRAFLWPPSSKKMAFWLIIMIKGFAAKNESASEMQILALSAGIIGTDVHPFTLLPLSYQVHLPGLSANGMLADATV